MEDNWEENIYWSHFRSVQFYQTLSGPFDQQLAIPQNFTKNLKEKLGDYVSLKVPSGAIWNVGVVASGDTSLLKNGWKDFVEDNSLRENDLLIFKYIGESRFEVLMFDHQSQSEKAASYFVKKRTQNQQGGCKRKETPVSTTDKSQHWSDYVPDEAERSEDRNAESANDIMQISPPKTVKTDGDWTPTSDRQDPQTDEPIQVRRGLRSRIQSDPKPLVSRRPITEEGKESALLKANSASFPESLVVVMQSSQVSKNYFMLIPTSWANAYLPRKNIDIILCVEGKTWKTTFFCNRVGGGRLRGGWKRFATENHLEEFDVCLFNISEITSDSIFMEVSIFRAVEEEIEASPDSQ